MLLRRLKASDIEACRGNGYDAITGATKELRPTTRTTPTRQPLTPQQKMITTLRADQATSEEEHFRLVLVQTEMERAKYLVRSYVRVRLHKVSMD